MQSSKQRNTKNSNHEKSLEDLDREVFNGAKEQTETEQLISYLDDEKDRRSSESLPSNIRIRWSRAAFWLSIVSSFITLSFSLASFLVSNDTASSSIFANAFDALLGTVSSFAVAWRFRDELNGEEISSSRERIATFGIGISFIATGIATVAASIVHLTETDHPRKTQEMVIILWCSLAAFLLLSYIQRCLAGKLDSQSMWAASADSALAAAMSLGIVISTYVYRSWPKDMWWLDHAVACILGCISAVYGTYLVSLVALCNREVFGSDKQSSEEKMSLK
ncbi:uncharacterized protein LOC110254944 [Exaiptasia diaphana]|uniref:Transmembrane protein 163 n=1 Tax=Exaiptasia diaphana TaxID=2652724 RepID=A0A913YXG8_EXADI|nr:uncharacterized protein LOC110254944 [Exaiptasia diaphana]KXJ19352.1 Transmembrane protein 163 [Exaiptasia diaphana]